ncbi:MAG TPA: hypothetical protein VLB46_11110 [Pyrinomonadaceae bacterium]|nr:hypothetical protein [Pyrinomonadaceae bacterium]
MSLIPKSTIGTLKVTMDKYVQAVSDEKRKAKSKVVKMLLPDIRKREAV